MQKPSVTTTTIHTSFATTFADNVLWFLASLALAFVVWIIATSQADPIIQRSFTNIPIQLQTDPGYLITNAATLRRSVTVNVRARQSVMDLLTSEDITVKADLHGMPTGTNTVQLQAVVSQARQAVADTKPTQISVTLELEQREQKPVVLKILNEPPVGFTRGSDTLSEAQVLVSGSASKVAQVAQLEAQIDLSQQRTKFSRQIELIPVDVNGVRVTEVTVAQTILCEIDITQRDDVKVVFVTPNIDRASLSDAYIYLGIIDYTPKTVSVTGDKNILDSIPETFQTELINLSDATGEFTANAAVKLPDGVFLAEAGQQIQVTIGIEVREEIIQLEAIPVEFAGQTTGLNFHAIPNEVTVVVSGPQPVVDLLTAANVRVIVDVQGLAVGDYELEPVGSVNVGQILPENISVLPDVIRISITSDTLTPSPTPAISATPEPG